MTRPRLFEIGDELLAPDERHHRRTGGPEAHRLAVDDTCRIRIECAHVPSIARQPNVSPRKSSRLAHARRAATAS